LPASPRRSGRPGWTPSTPRLSGRAPTSSRVIRQQPAFRGAVATSSAAGLWVLLFNAKKEAYDGGGPQLDRLAGEIAERLALAALRDAE